MMNISAKQCQTKFRWYDQKDNLKLIYSKDDLYIRWSQIWVLLSFFFCILITRENWNFIDKETLTQIFFC